MSKRASRRWRLLRNNRSQRPRSPTPAEPTLPSAAALTELQSEHEAPSDNPPARVRVGHTHRTGSNHEDEPRTTVGHGYSIQAYGQGVTAAGEGGEEGASSAYGQVRYHYPGQFGTGEGWEGDGERGIASHPTSEPEEAEWSKSYFPVRRGVRPDSEIASDVRAVLNEGWINAEEVGFFVKDGRVHLHGLVESRHDKRVLEELIDALPGVAGVEDSLRVVPPGGPHGLPPSDPTPSYG